MGDLLRIVIVALILLGNVLRRRGVRACGRSASLLDRVVDAAREHRRISGLDSQPERLDLDDGHCKLAKESGVKVAISSSARTDAELGFLRFGIDEAHRGWLEAAKVLSTRTLAGLRRLIAPRLT